MKFSSDLQQNVETVQQRFIYAEDLVIKQLSIDGIHATVMHIKGVADAKSISDFILLPLTSARKVPKKNSFEYIKNNLVLISDVEDEENVLRACQLLARGKVLLLLEHETRGIIIAADKVHERAIEEPPTSAVIRGPREGFNENIKTNITCIRKILATPKLKSRKLEVGKFTKTQINVLYIEGIADKKVLEKIINKLKLINIDGIIDSYYIIQFLEERPKSIFKQAGMTEKPDVVAAKILEGRIAILVDGSPIVLTLPFMLMEDLQSADDYYQQPYRVMVIRLIRIISIALTILLPGLYIAMQMFHYQAIPLRFLVTILNSTQGLPFTPFAEIVVVTILFEILYEASLRMPKYLGLALSIVGALILGDTAVKAGLISPPAVMIVAVSGIAIYTIPDEAGQMSLLRIFFLFAGGLLGFYGLMLLAILLVVYLSDFDNYGAPYLSPFAPQVKKDQKDAIFKTDLTNNKSRPASIPNDNSTRLR